MNWWDAAPGYSGQFGNRRGEREMQMNPNAIYQRTVDWRVSKLAPDWESRLGQTALCWGAISWVRLKAGWLIGVIGCAIVLFLMWLGLPDTLTFSLALLVIVLCLFVMVPAVSAAKRQVKATMQHLGLPEKPGVTVQALQSPAHFDIWLLEAREHHYLMDDPKDS